MNRETICKDITGRVIMETDIVKNGLGEKSVVRFINDNAFLYEIKSDGRISTDYPTQINKLFQLEIIDNEQ